MGAFVCQAVWDKPRSADYRRMQTSYLLLLSSTIKYSCRNERSEIGINFKLSPNRSHLFYYSYNLLLSGINNLINEVSQVLYLLVHHDAILRDAILRDAICRVQVRQLKKATVWIIEWN